MDVTSYLLGKKAGGGTPINNQNKDITVTENGTTTVSADAGYTGLGTVGVTTNVQPDLESKSITITENGTTTVTPTAGKDGLSEVEVTTNVSGGGDLSEYFENTITGSSSSSDNKGWYRLIKKVPGIIYVGITDCTSCFSHFLGDVQEIRTLEGVKPTKMGSCFSDMQTSSLNVSHFDTSEVTTMTSCFTQSRNFNTLDLTSWNTSKVTNFSYMFNSAFGLTRLNLSNFDFGACDNIKSFFGNNVLNNLTEIQFGYDLGKGYSTTASSNNSNYTLSIANLTLTHDSIMSIINGLYDIASAGIQPQSFTLGYRNSGTITSEEKAIATAKGWIVS